MKLTTISILLKLRTTVLALTFWAAAATVWAEKGGFNFHDADILSVIDAVAKVTGTNFIVDPRVKGKVTMIAGASFDDKSIYEVFLSILKVHGYIAVPISSNVVKIVPEAETRTEAGLLDEDPASAKGGGVAMKVIRIHNTKAALLVQILRPLISRNGYIAAHTDSNSIVISDIGGRISKIVRVIEFMDKEKEGEVKVVKIKHADAAEVAKSLAAVVKSGSGNVAQKINVQAEERTNSVLIKGEPERIEELLTVIETIDVPISHEKSGTSVIKLSHAKAKNVADILNKMVSVKGSEFAQAAMHVSHDEKANSVIVSGPDKHIEKLERLVRTIDVERAQVMVEALIVDISADKTRNLGIQWGSAASSFGVSGENISSSTIGSLVGVIKGGSKISFGVLAEALATDADANIISSPSLITMENDEAEIEVGREVPFITGSYSNTGGSSTNPQNPFQTINRENIGFKLKITPQINKGNTIKLNIEQEFSSILPASIQQNIGASDVVTSKRLIKTNVLVENGNILVLGGLIDDQARETDTRVMGISRIPILGKLFRHRETKREKRNMMVFIRPIIVRTAKQGARRLTKTRYNYIRDIQRDRYNRGVKLLPGDEQPLMTDHFHSQEKKSLLHRFRRKIEKFKKSNRNNNHSNFNVLNYEG